MNDDTGRGVNINYLRQHTPLLNRIQAAFVDLRFDSLCPCHMNKHKTKNSLIQVEHSEKISTMFKSSQFHRWNDEGSSLPFVYY